MLHTRFQQIAMYGALLTVLTACGGNSRSKDDEKMLRQSLNGSAQILEETNHVILAEMENEANDPPRTRDVRIWLPLVQQLTNYTGQAAVYLKAFGNKLETVKSAAGFIADSGHTLRLRLQQLKEQLKQLHPETAGFFSPGKNGSLFPDSMLQPDLIYEMLRRANRNGALRIIAMVQNNIRVIENRLASYFKSKISGGCILSYEKFSALIGQNTTILRPGEAIEITAGVGAFSTAAQPKITINGQAIETGPVGAAIYKQKAADKPGTYRLPVTIEYIDQEGKRQVFQKTVSYTVVK